MNLMKFERASGFRKQDAFPEEERLARILRYLRRNGEIRSSKVADYVLANKEEVG